MFSLESILALSLKCHIKVLFNVLLETEKKHFSYMANFVETLKLGVEDRVGPNG